MKFCHSKKTHARQMQDTAQHIAYLEANERKGEDARVYALSLEERLKCAELLRERAVTDAQRKYEEDARRNLNAERKKEKWLFRLVVLLDWPFRSGRV